MHRGYSIHQERRGESTAGVGGEGVRRGGRREGGREGGKGGREETYNHPNNLFFFNPFYPLWICVAR